MVPVGKALTRIDSGGDAIGKLSGNTTVCDGSDHGKKLTRNNTNSNKRAHRRSRHMIAPLSFLSARLSEFYHVRMPKRSEGLKLNLSPSLLYTLYYQVLIQAHLLAVA